MTQVMVNTLEGNIEGRLAEVQRELRALKIGELDGAEMGADQVAYLRSPALELGVTLGRQVGQCRNSADHLTRQSLVITASPAALAADRVVRPRDGSHVIEADPLGIQHPADGLNREDAW
jgi:hypothetical protein